MSFQSIIIDFIKSFNKSIISIDIGFRNIKVVEVVVKNGKKVRLENYGMAVTPRECIRNGMISDVRTLSNVISNIIMDKGMKAERAKIVMSGTCIISRVIVVDKLPGKDLDIIVRDAVSDIIPINVDNYVIDYKILKENFEGNNFKLKVFVTIVRKNIIESYIKILESCGLEPISVDIPANSTAKFFDRDIMVDTNQSRIPIPNHNASDKGSFAVIDFGSETTIVNILSDKILDFNRVILIGSTNLDNIVSQVLGADSVESERIKIRYGLQKQGFYEDEEHIMVNRKFQETIDKLVNQIKMCFSFYQFRCFGNPVERVYIIGGGSRLKGLREYMEENLRIPVFPVSLMSIENVNVSKKIDKENLHFLINSVGITL